jgi:hypothetical protein
VVLKNGAVPPPYMVAAAACLAIFTLGFFQGDW